MTANPVTMTQLASANPSAAAEAARIQRRDAALQTLTSSLRQPSIGAFQGPRQPNDPTMPRGIPAPQSMGVLPTAPPMPRARPQAPLSQNPYDMQRTPTPYSGYGSFAPPRPPSAPLAQNAYDTERAVAQYGGYGNFTPPDRTAGLSQNEYDTARAGRYTGYGNFSPPRINAGLSQNEYATPQGRYGGYGNFATPDRTAPVARNAFDTQRAPPRYSGYGTTPFAGMPPAPQKQPKLTTEQTAWSVPPIGGSLPDYKARALGEWSANRRPPAAPHLGTSTSQTAQSETDDSIWEGANDWIQAKVEQAKPYVERAAEGQKQVADAQANPVKNFFLNMMLGGATGGGMNPNADPMGRGANPFPYQPSFGSLPMQPQQQEAQAIPVDILTALKAELAAKGATPEELAIIDQLIAEQARA